MRKSIRSYNSTRGLSKPIVISLYGEMFFFLWDENRSPELNITSSARIVRRTFRESIIDAASGSSLCKAS